ncbi:MAG: hypothetical protein M9941_05555 [Anaerolineae bacterium]|nr:hypothetical protein [Anaerolineae bacterium]
MRILSDLPNLSEPRQSVARHLTATGTVILLLLAVLLFAGSSTPRAQAAELSQPIEPLTPIMAATESARIIASTDDAEEVGPGGTLLGGEGNIYTNSTDLELVADDEPATAGNQTVGLRFRNLDIPRYAAITNAYITFRAVSPDSPNTNNNTANLLIEGHDADNPATFPATNNNPSFNISSRTRTTASVNWTPGPWSAGTNYSTPDLKSIVQEIVNRSGWNANNSMVFIITGTGSRSAASYNGDAANAPLLVVEYETGINLTPNNTGQGDPGDTISYAHVLALTGGVTDVFNLSAVSSNGWTTRIYKDLNLDGVKDDNVPITSTPLISSPTAYGIVVELDAPGATPIGTVDVMTVTATGQSSGLTDSATDTSGIGQPPFTEPIVDGIIDDAYIYNPNSTIQDYCDASGEILARTFTTYDINDPNYDNIYVVLEMDRTLVDNTYGTNIHPSWGGTSHSLSSMDGSDRAQFDLFYANGSPAYSIMVDYAENNLSTPSGWGSAGITGGEGDDQVNGSLPPLSAAYFDGESSLGYDLNTFCSSPSSCVVDGVNLFSNSPPVDLYYEPLSPTFNDWEYSYQYEFSIDAAAFGAGGFGSVTIPFTHVSPNKVGSNEIPVTPCTGSIGDRVWYDTNADGVQDPAEVGINGVQLILYRDNGDGVFDPDTDQPQGLQTTTGDGDYLFTGLGPDVYFVDVINSTIPDGLVITTNNDPYGPITLGLGQNFLDADFGYYSPSELEVEKIQTSPNPARVGESITYTIRITNTGPVTVTTLPLEDYYDNSVISYQSATPSADLAPGDGTLTWFDLTTTFGDLGPGDVIEVEVVFLAIGPTTNGAGAAPLPQLVVEPVVDGLLDPEYNFVGTVPPGGDAPGNLYQYEGSNQCYYAFVVDRSFNDNVYAEGGEPYPADPQFADGNEYVAFDGWDSHTLGNLLGSDEASFNIAGLSNTLKLDYVTKDGNGGFIIDYFNNAPAGSVGASSLLWNLNSSNWDGTYPNQSPEDKRYSPPYDHNDGVTQGDPDYWEWAMIYEFSVPKGALGGTCGAVTLAGAHNSPSKNDDNLGTLGDRVWLDENANGIQEPSEVGIPGVRLNLIQNGQVFRSTVTEPGESGYYIFNNLEPGTYTVDVVESSLPPGYTITYDYDNGTVNPDGQATYTLTSGQDFLDLDFGYVAGQGTIGDRVFYDVNGDGLPDNDGDPGLNGVTVELYFEGNLYATQVTSGDGGYLFDGLPPGDYEVRVIESTLPASGLSLTTGNQPFFYTLGQDEVYLQADFGYRAEAPDSACDLAIIQGATDENGGTPPTVADEECTEIRLPRPDVEVTKLLVSESPVLIGELITFTIQVKNVGPTTITVLPLEDYYDPAYLEFISADPA